MTDLIGTRLGPYDIQEIIRHGGMATVYKAYQPSLERFVAVKVMLSSSDPQFAARFQREARAVAQLQHPNIVQMYDYGNYNDHVYLVMQYIDDGRSLLDLQGQEVSLVQALRLTVNVLSALSHAHARGIVHRDIKPSNILLAGDLWPMLIDFGIAKLLNDNQNLTRAGLAVGTPAYMSPEQAEGRAVDVRSDLYSLGVVLFELVTGEVPFSAETPMALLMKHVYAPPPPPRSIKPDLPPVVEALLLRALAKDPAARYQTADEMSQALNQIIFQLEQGPSQSTLVNLYQLGQQAMRNGQWDDAVGHLSRLVDLDPQYQDGTNLLRVALVAQQRVRTETQAPAVPSLDTIVAPRPGNQSPITAATAAQTTANGSSARSPRATSPLSPDDLPPASATPAEAKPKRNYLVWGVGAFVLLVAAGFLVSRFVIVPPTNNDPTANPTAGGSIGIADTAKPAATEAPKATASSVPEPTAAPAGTTVAAPEPVGQLLYESDFQDVATEPVRSGLRDQKDDPVFQHGFHAPGVYHMLLPNPNEAHQIMLPRFAYSEVSFQADTWDNSDDRSGTAVSGLVFRALDNDHYYTVLLDPRKGQYAIRKREGADNWSDLVAWKASPLVKRQDGVNLLRVDAVGDTFTVYLNGSQLDQVSDSSYSFGMIGMLVVNTDAPQPHFHFDNLKVWSNDQPPPASELQAERDDPHGAMVLIPGGDFILGGAETGDNQAHIVPLPDFYIDRTEVTNAAYGECVAADGCTPLSSNASSTHPNYGTDAQYADYPVVNVNWTQAEAFCRWAGKRLPSEAEWEKAASWNPTTRTKTAWPWGNEFDPSKLNSDESRNGDTTKVGQFGPEQNGTVDMGGNVSEWTNSLFKPFPYKADDGREDPQASGDRVYRGGSWAQTGGKAQSVVRFSTTPNYADREIGFRCAANP